MQLPVDLADWRALCPGPYPSSSEQKKSNAALLETFFLWSCCLALRPDRSSFNQRSIKTCPRTRRIRSSRPVCLRRLKGASALPTAPQRRLCRIARDRCGHVPARTKSKKKSTTIPLRNKTNTKKPNQSKHNTTHKTGEQLRQTWRETWRETRRETACRSTALNCPHTPRCSNTIANITNQAQMTYSRPTTHIWKQNPPT